MGKQMGEINISVGIQLWQIVFSAFLCLVSVAGAAFGAAITFVRRSECAQHGTKTSDQFKQLFDLVREIKEDIGRLEGKTDK